MESKVIIINWNAGNLYIILKEQKIKKNHFSLMQSNVKLMSSFWFSSRNFKSWWNFDSTNNWRKLILVMKSSFKCVERSISNIIYLNLFDFYQILKFIQQLNYSNHNQKLSIFVDMYQIWILIWKYKSLKTINLFWCRAVLHSFYFFWIQETLNIEK